MSEITPIEHLRLDIAELRGEISALSQVVSHRLDDTQQRLVSEVDRAKQDNGAIRSDLNATHKSTRALADRMSKLELQWSRAIGIGVGISLTSGTLSGGLVAMFAAMGG